MFVSYSSRHFFPFHSLHIKQVLFKDLFENVIMMLNVKNNQVKKQGCFFYKKQKFSLKHISLFKTLPTKGRYYWNFKPLISILKQHDFGMYITYLLSNSSTKSFIFSLLRPSWSGGCFLAKTKIGYGIQFL